MPLRANTSASLSLRFRSLLRQSESTDVKWWGLTSSRLLSKVLMGRLLLSQGLAPQVCAADLLKTVASSGDGRQVRRGIGEGAPGLSASPGDVERLSIQLVEFRGTPTPSSSRRPRFARDEAP